MNGSDFLLVVERRYGRATIRQSANGWLLTVNNRFVLRSSSLKRAKRKMEKVFNRLASTRG